MDVIILWAEGGEGRGDDRDVDLAMSFFRIAEDGGLICIVAIFYTKIEFCIAVEVEELKW